VQIAESFDLPVQVFSTPTSILLAFGEGTGQIVHLLRVEPGSVDLGKLVEFDELLEDVGARRIELVDARKRIEALVRWPE
jgi:uncharacterized membrane protein YjjP (DUF1212 family)